MPPKPPDYTLLSKAWNIVAAIVFLTLLGFWLDKKFHTTALFTIMGAILGIGYALYEAWVLINKK